MVYDNWQGGIGVMEAAYERMAEVYAAAITLMQDCACDNVVYTTCFTRCVVSCLTQVVRAVVATHCTGLSIVCV